MEKFFKTFTFVFIFIVSAIFESACFITFNMSLIMMKEHGFSLYYFCGFIFSIPAMAACIAFWININGKIFER